MMKVEANSPTKMGQFDFKVSLLRIQIHPIPRVVMAAACLSLRIT